MMMLSQHSAFGDLKTSITALVDNYPATEKDEFVNRIKPLQNLLDNGLWHLGRLGDDLNPAEAIFEILTNDYWGCSYTIFRIDIVSLLNIGVVLEEEKMGVSCLINKTAKAGQVISKILNHVNGVCYDDPSTGKLTFKLIRNDYTIDNIPKFSPHNCASLEFTRLDWSETTSSVTTSFTYANDKFNTSTLMVSDIANIRITKNYTESQVDGEYFTTEENARILAQRQLLSSAYPLSAVNIECNRIAYNVTVGDPILINWLPYGIEKQVFRVTGIDYGALDKGTIKITAIEYTYSNCKSLTSITMANTNNLTAIPNVFYGCSSMVSVDGLDTTNVTDMSYTFYNCVSLENLELNVNFPEEYFEKGLSSRERDHIYHSIPNETFADMIACKTLYHHGEEILKIILNNKKII